MNFNDYDILLQYVIRQKRLESSYDGNPDIYTDGKPLEIFRSGSDLVNNKMPKFAIGTVTYLIFNDKVLMLNQNKEDKVVDTLVGLGGKVAPKIESLPQSEKEDLDKIITAYNYGTLDTSEDIKICAKREVMEETSTYLKDNDGNYINKTLKNGLIINSNNLKDIGISKVRIITDKKTESWLIQNYSYELSDEEFEFIETSVAKENREGSLLWLSKEDAVEKMSFADRLIFENANKNTRVSEIRDKVNNHVITRESDISNNEKINLYIDGNVIETENDFEM